MELWHGFKSESFRFEGHDAIIVFPESAKDTTHTEFQAILKR